MKIGVNTFGLGPYLQRDEKAVWQGLLDSGVKAIEPCIGFHHEPTDDEYQKVKARGIFHGIFDKVQSIDVIKMLRNMGFDVVSFQLQRAELNEKDLNEAVSFMKDNGLTYCVYSFMDSSVEKIKSYEHSIRAAIELFEKNGLTFLIHNHDMEWHKDGDTSVMEWLIDNIPSLKYEIDLGWTEYAGVDSVALLNKYPERFPILHVKEIAKGKKAWLGTPFCTAPGKGTLPLEDIIGFAKANNLSEYSIIIDQDDSVDGDIISDLAQGVKVIEKYLKEKGDINE